MTQSMDSRALLGNQTLLRQVHAMLRRGTLSHCLLLTGPEGSGKSSLCRWLAAALQCRAPREGAPCGLCPECHRALEGIHPDVITVDSDRQTIPVDTVRQLHAEAWVRPNQGLRKIFCFPRADALGEAAQNALLKLIEEPPSYGVFLLESRNPDLLLPTVRSRATELRMEPLPVSALEAALAQRQPDSSPADRAAAARRCGGWLGQALQLLSSGGARCPEAEAVLQALMQAKPRAALLRACVPLEKKRRDELLPVMETLRAVLTEALAVRGGVSGGEAARTLAGRLTARALSRSVGAVQTAGERLQANVSPAHAMGALAAALADAVESGK